MRTASLDQSSPTADPKITVAVGGQTYNTEGTGADATQRVMRVLTDEQAWGSVYVVILDNSDETLNGLSLEGLAVTLNMAFIGETADNFPPLRVLFQEHTSEEGKLLLKLTCVDEWTFIEATETTYTGAQFNQPWQTATELDVRYMPDEVTLVKDVPELYDDLLANGNKTVWEIIQYLMAAAGATVAVGDVDSYINTLKPPLQVNNVRSGIRQALDTTACYLKLHTDGVFRPYNPSLHSTVYTFSTLDLFYTNAHEAMATIPNRIHVWAYSETGSAWLNGTADDSDSQTALDRVVPRHYYIATLDSKVTRTQAELDTMAEGILAKVQHEGAQGEIVAPMHVSLELFDKVAVTDSRYSPSRTIVGYVHRIQREYDRGVYRIKIQLGGVTGGYTPPGGQDPGGLIDAPAFKPPTPDWEAPPWDEVLPKAVQGYMHDIKFTSVSWQKIDWTAGTIKFYDGTTQSVLAGSTGNLATDDIYYIYFDLAHASPDVLKVCKASDYLTTYFSVDTSVLCVVQRVAGEMAIMLPGWEKQPLIVADMIHMAGLKNWTDGAGNRYQLIGDTHIDGTGIKISGVTSFAPAYDPSHKGKTFHTTPTTPYNLGDIWIDDTVYKHCTTARQSGSFRAGDWSTSTKKRIGSTYISDGKIYLWSVAQTTDAQYVTAGDKTTWTGRTQVYRQTTAPTSGMKAGDIWYDTSDGDKPHTYDGFGWIPSYTIIDGGYIKTGTIEANRLNFTPYIIGTNNLGDIADGGDYGKVSIYAIDANGQVDLSKAGVINKLASYITETSGRRWAEESGADITGNHTAANTAMVGARTAASVADGVGRALDGLTSSGYVNKAVAGKWLILDGDAVCLGDFVVSGSVGAGKSLYVYGEISAGGGAVKLDSSGILVDAGVSTTYGKVRLKYSSHYGYLFIGATGNVVLTAASNRAVSLEAQQVSMSSCKFMILPRDSSYPGNLEGRTFHNTGTNRWVFYMAGAWRYITSSTSGEP